MLVYINDCYHILTEHLNFSESTKFGINPLRKTEIVKDERNLSPMFTQNDVTHVDGVKCSKCLFSSGIY